jgi:hypothetical protein
MKISDIQTVKADWMEGYGNDPQLKFVLKDGHDLTPWGNFRWHQHGNIFYAEHEGEVHFIAHSRSDHNGFGGAMYELHMADDWTPADWHDCDTVQSQWGSGGGSHSVKCWWDANMRILHIKGPWSSSSSSVNRFFGPCIEVSVLTPQYNNKLRSPKYYESMRKQGRAWDGTYLATACTVEFARQAVDTLAPWLELYEGDYGWYPKKRDEAPKNPRKGRAPSYFGMDLSREQSRVVEW